jgi:hypothetical protein
MLGYDALSDPNPAGFGDQRRASGANPCLVGV